MLLNFDTYSYPSYTLFQTAEFDCELMKKWDGLTKEIMELRLRYDLANNECKQIQLRRAAIRERATGFVNTEDLSADADEDSAAIAQLEAEIELTGVQAYEAWETRKTYEQVFKEAATLLKQPQLVPYLARHSGASQDAAARTRSRASASVLFKRHWSASLLASWTRAVSANFSLSARRRAASDCLSAAWHFSSCFLRRGMAPSSSSEPRLWESSADIFPANLCTDSPRAWYRSSRSSTRLSTPASASPKPRASSSASMVFNWVGASSGVVSRLRGVKGGTCLRAAAMAAILLAAAERALRALVYRHG